MRKRGSPSGIFDPRSGLNDDRSGSFCPPAMLLGNSMGLFSSEGAYRNSPSFYYPNSLAIFTTGTPRLDVGGETQLLHAMISPEQFRQAWLDTARDPTLTTYTYEEMADTTLQKGTKDFLALAGLPKETSHALLAFNEKLYQSHLENVTDAMEIEEGDFTK